MRSKKDGYKISNPFKSPPAPISQTISDIVGAPVLSSVPFFTRQLPWYARHASEGNAFELVVFALLSLGSSIWQPALTKTETELGHSGSIICANTNRELLFVVETTESTPSRVLRRFPISSLTDCTRTKRHAVSVNFRFESGEDLTLEFYGNNAKLIAFTDAIVDSQSIAKTNE